MKIIAKAAIVAVAVSFLPVSGFAHDPGWFSNPNHMSCSKLCTSIGQQPFGSFHDLVCAVDFDVDERGAVGRNPNHQEPGQCIYVKENGEAATTDQFLCLCS